MMEMLLIKPLGYLILVGLPCWLLLQLVPKSVARVLTTKLWDDPQ